MRIGYSLEGSTRGALGEASGASAYREGLVSELGEFFLGEGDDVGGGGIVGNGGGERRREGGDVKVAATEERPGEIHRATSAGRDGAIADEAPHSSRLSASGACLLRKVSTSV